MVFRTTVSIHECFTVMNQYLSSSPDDVPLGVIVNKEVKIEEYVKNLKSILQQAKDHGVSIGDNQLHWMAQLLNAAGFSSDR